jgi:hypothetical protein
MSRDTFGALVLAVGVTLLFCAASNVLYWRFGVTSRAPLLFGATVVAAAVLGLMAGALVLLRRITGATGRAERTRLSDRRDAGLSAEDADRELAAQLREVLAVARTDAEADDALLRWFASDPGEPLPAMRLADLHRVLSGYRRGGEATAGTRVLIERLLADMEREEAAPR